MSTRLRHATADGPARGHRPASHCARSAALCAFALLAWAWPVIAAGAGAEEGLVSWYGERFHERATASGEPFDADGLTMAHPSLPFGTRVKVTNLRNGRSVVVRVNDRGPQVRDRIADLSRAAAERIGMLRRGLVRARLEVLAAAGDD